jgi:hypothetical protein
VVTVLSLAAPRAHCAAGEPMVATWGLSPTFDLTV